MLSASTEITIRFADCDPMGHVNNAVYFTYMEQARVELFRKVCPGFPFIIAEISCKFLKPTVFDQTLRVTVEAAEVKNSSFVFDYIMSDKKSGEQVATGRSVQVWYDYSKGKPAPIPEEYRKILGEMP